MKFKLLQVISLVMFTFLLCFCAAPAHAQTSGGYTTTLNGGTNNTAHAATNTYALTQTVGEFDHAGLTLSAKANGTNASTWTVRVSQSYDGGSTYETTPSLSATVTANGTTTVESCTDFSIPNTTHLKIVKFENPNATTDATNIVCTWRLKSPKRLTATSTR